MAYNRNITADDKVFHDTDRVLRYAVYQDDATAEQIAAGTAVPEDVSGWALSWTLRQNVHAEAALIQKATTGDGITIVGTYDPDPETNTQRIEVQLEATDTYAPTADPPVDIAPSRSYAYALKRTDDGFEEILAWGKFTLLKSAARE